jgi:hypothetical protein
MAYSRRSTPPPEPTTRERLARVVRTTRLPDGLDVDALVADLSEHDLRERMRGLAVPKVLDEALQVYLGAYQVLRRTGDSERGAVRGCSLWMLVLAIKQALDLVARIERHDRELERRSKAIDAALAALRQQFARATTLRDQARRLLVSVARDDEALRQAVSDAATAHGAQGALSVAMARLAAIGRAILSSTSPPTVQRARLLGLDDAYIASLEALSRELALGESELHRLSVHDDEDDKILLEAGRTVSLVLQVVEAFEDAHEVDADVPKLKLVHARKLARRLSKLPPPPLPVPRAAGASPHALPPRRASPEALTGQGTAFVGNFGKGR